MVHDIFVKVKLEVTGTSTALNVFGSRRSSDMDRVTLLLRLLPNTFRAVDVPVSSSFTLSKMPWTKGINRLSLEKMTMRKDVGDMGFPSLHGLNLAMLRKLGWKFSNKNDAIVTKIFKAKYFSKGEFLDAQLGHNPSYV
ncbi:hypothetical protein JHK86_006531 [Glycine max]|nr:hypothetical protein JHK86_006531 [Glycine max]